MKNTKQKITNIIWKRIANRLFKKKKKDENNEKNPLKSSKKTETSLKLFHVLSKQWSLINRIINKIMVNNMKFYFLITIVTKIEIMNQNNERKYQMKVYLNI